MRKICSSSKYWWSMSLSAQAEARSVPNGFSMTMRDRSISLASASIWMTAWSAAGGTLR